jgi:hypothetical protein
MNMTLSRSALVATLALAVAVVAAGCGGRKGTITLDIVTSPADDPFASAASVSITVGDGMGERVTKTVPVMNGRFDVSFDQKPQKEGAPILVEALDSSGATIAWGRTPTVVLQPTNDPPVSVYVGRANRVAPSRASLPAGRRGLASASVTGLGVMYMGGLDENGVPSAKTSLYSVFTHAIIETAAMNRGRAYASAAGTIGVRAVVFGGATTSADGEPINTTEIFDPSQSFGTWAPLAGDAVEARSHATASLHPSGALLISGGILEGGMRLQSAALLSTDSAPKVTALPGTMVAARARHCAAPASFPDGEGALLFGGLGPAGGPVAERLVGQTFFAYDGGGFTGVASRDNATCTRLPDGRVLILGGLEAGGGAVKSGLLVTPGQMALVTPLPDALSVAREGHTATIVGGLLLVCGGANESGALQASCDRIDVATAARVDTIALNAGRRDHVADVTETGNLLITGGVIDGGAATASIEIYTPPL